MRYLRYLALLGILLIPAAYSHAQVSVGIGYGAPVYGPPVCSYGYYSYYPYACAPYGYYGPAWFSGGIFIGAGPWLRAGLRLPRLLPLPRRLWIPWRLRLPSWLRLRRPPRQLRGRISRGCPSRPQLLQWWWLPGWWRWRLPRRRRWLPWRRRTSANRQIK